MSLDASAPGRPLAHPGEDIGVVGIEIELRAGRTILVFRAFACTPRILHDGVEGSSGQIEPHVTSARRDHLRLEPGEDPEGLGVSLEAPDRRGDVGERAFAVVPVGRMA